MRRIALLLLLILPLPALAAEKVALVIGIGDYAHLRPLANAGNDARLMHRTLTGMGFDAGPEPLLDLDHDGMRLALRDFAQRARDAKYAVIYYAGHGMEFGGFNYLIPKDAELADNASADYEAIRLDQVMGTLRQATGLGLVLLDSCRNNPFENQARRSNRGNENPVFRAIERRADIARIVVGFAAQLGRPASDGEGANSPYAIALAETLPTPGIELSAAIARAARKVEILTRGGQNPHLDAPGAALEGFMLVPAVAKPPEPPSPAPKPVEDPNAAAQRDWDEVKDTTSVAVLEAFIQDHSGSGTYVALARTAIADLTRNAAAKRDWDEVKDTTSVAVLEAFTRDHSGSGTYVALAREAIARLTRPAPSPAPAPVVAPPPSPAFDPAPFLTDTDAASLAQADRMPADMIQAGLKALGFYRGAIDGSIGPGTRQGIADFLASLGDPRLQGLDPRLKVVLMKKAEATGEAEAQRQLGLMYWTGIGVRQNLKEAERLLSAAAQTGSKEAAANLIALRRK